MFRLTDSLRLPFPCLLRYASVRSTGRNVPVPTVVEQLDMLMDHMCASSIMA